jgi:hypothetical protein
VEASMVVGRGVDTLLLNVYYIDADGKPDKCDLASFLVQQLNVWKNRWSCRGPSRVLICTCTRMGPVGGNGRGS